MTRGGIRIKGVLRRKDPPGAPLPLVFDSPHSGWLHPADFNAAAPMALLRRSEDFAVDRLFGVAPDHGATLIAADFPRCYIDPNRPPADIDPLLLAEPWPEPAAPEGRSKDGVGLVWRLIGPGQPIYTRRLSHQEVKRRLEGYYQPYHRELGETLDRLQAAFGAVWYVNCHSMPGQIPPPAPGLPRAAGLADFVIGDRDGATASPDFCAVVVETLRGMGYSVAINRPYKGGDLIRRHGLPELGRHALQIEVNRGLYMDEERIEESAGFAPLQQAMARLIVAIAAHVRAELGLTR